MNRIEGPSYNTVSQPTVQPSVSSKHQHSFEQALETTPDQQMLKERQQRWLQGEPLENVLADFEPATQRKVTWQWYQALPSDKQPSQRAQLEDKLIAPVQEQLWSQFGGLTGNIKPSLDMPELRKIVREFAPTGRQQETVLLKILGKIEPIPGNEYLNDLIRQELKTLIPRNGMVDNLMRNSHKPDLEE
ncbi:MULTISPECIES: YopR family T3SS polymerization control protein [unclassified Photorhabdus]|uniref:YopR family T3SS polymerization control protein n=1 Tax=unclassified Photorhabdus TaxID=2620880 RepID=UPI000DCD1803|nr:MULTISPECIES: YopR family T3SS polymerization control protein [unclassified Photorhabdus]RAW95022.1 YopR family type III secretion effector [Photorhabdus sp. S9-53]RAW95170.1 YopR family type III secretion effector [Photorhabdus sp. S10-54]RAW99362.1 YopR family type III secretion effector [Photorhabdus sp. S8-52]